MGKRNPRVKWELCHRPTTRAELSDAALSSGFTPSPTQHCLDTVVRMRRAWEAKGIKFTEPEETTYFGRWMMPDRSYRVEVKSQYGERTRGYITLSTGWSPSFMLLLTTRSVSSSYLLNDKDEIVAVWRRR